MEQISQYRPELRDLKITEFLKPVILVIETIPIHDLLLKMQREHTHMAILLMNTVELQVLSL